MTRIHRASNVLRRGFSLVEIQAAFIVLGFSVAALVPFAVAQLKLVAVLEQRMPPNTTYVVMTRDHSMVALLANGGTPQPTILQPAGGAFSATTSLASSNTTPNKLEVVSPPAPGTGSLDMSVTVKVTKVP